MNKKEKKPKEDLSKTSSNKILIKVYKDFGSDTQYLKAEYDAIEQRDLYNNLVSINKEFKHNEDTDFSMDDVYMSMQVILEFKNLENKERIAILNKKIEYQEKLVKYLDKFAKLNAIYNYQDEELKLRDYRILRNYISKHDGRGSYFTIEKGVRVYSYNSMDGLLIPIWHGVDTYSQYPDHTRKLKITIQEDQRMRQELAMFNRDKKIGNILTVGLIIVVILIAIFIFGIFKTWDLYDKKDAEIHGSAYQCAEYTSQVNAEITKFFSNEIIKDKLGQIEDEKKTDEEKKPENTLLNPQDIINKLS